MTDTEANEHRLIAAQIIWDLWNAGQREQLNMLAIQAASSRDKLPESKKKRAKPSAADEWAPV